MTAPADGLRLFSGRFYDWFYDLIVYRLHSKI